MSKPNFVKGPTRQQMPAITKEVGNAFTTYYTLLTFVTYGADMKKVQFVNPSHSQLADLTGRCVRQVINDVADLSAAGYIHIVRSAKGPRGRGKNSYHIMPLDPDGVPVVPVARGLDDEVHAESAPTDDEVHAENAHTDGGVGAESAHTVGAESAHVVEPLNVEPEKEVEPSSSSSGEHDDVDEANGEEEEEDSLSVSQFPNSEDGQAEKHPPQTAWIDDDKPQPDTQQMEAVNDAYEKVFGKLTGKAKGYLPGLVVECGAEAAIRGIVKVADLQHERKNTDNPIGYVDAYLPTYVRDNADRLASGDDGGMKDLDGSDKESRKRYEFSTVDGVPSLVRKKRIVYRAVPIEDDGYGWSTHGAGTSPTENFDGVGER